MTKQKTENATRLTFSDVIDVLVIKCRNEDSEKIGPITVGEIQAMLKIEKDIEVTDQTIRNKGVRKHGYFEKRWPDICSFNNLGDTRLRGLILKREEFLEEVTE